MALNAILAKAFKERVSANAPALAMLPGDIHYGGRADTSATRPFATLAVVETSREYDSGLAALVQYDLSLAIYGKQRGRDVNAIMQAVKNVFARGGCLLMIIPAGLGFVLSMVLAPNGSSLLEDDTEEFGKDVMVGRLKWLILVNEYEVASLP